MRSIVYLSHATSLLSLPELHRLLEQSRERNALNSLSGLLLYRKGSFIQVLEGPDDAVGATYDRISRDARHGGLLMLLDRQVETRSFPEWKMGFRDLTEMERSTPGHDAEIGELFYKDACAGNPGAVMTLLESFKRNMA